MELISNCFGFGNVDAIESKGSNRLCISRPQHATSLLKVAHMGSTAEKCTYLACSDISSCNSASSFQHEQSRWEVVWCGSDGMDEDAVRTLIASYRDTPYDYSWLRYSVVSSISDVYRNTEYRVSLKTLMIQRYFVSSSNTL